MKTHDQNAGNCIGLWLQTDRLCLRPIHLDDFHALCPLETDADVRRYFPEGILSIEKIAKELDRYLKEWHTLGFGMFGIFEKESRRFIGRGGFAKRPIDGDIEFGYLLLKPYWDQGLATEAAKILLEWGLKQIQTNRIIAFARIDHAESRRVLEKCGMKYYKTDIYRDQQWDFYEKLTCIP